MGGVGSGARPRDYPDDLVRLVRERYEAGETIAEIQRDIVGAKVQNVIRRYGIPTRRGIKRDQRGPSNDSWRGDDATYAAFHLRVQTARGKPQHCERCDASGPGRYEWANLTGNYRDIDDYERMCVTCHRRYDAARRRATGRRTSPPRR